jgi:putative tryptophan/tyrosine transport system substrate-binding protein
MRRREFLAVVGGAVAAWPLSVRAQQTPEGVPRVGFVYPGSKEAAVSRIEAIMSGLRVSGYAAPAQIELVARTADGDPARIAPLVEELIAKNVNLIIANGPPVLHVARSATRTIPIVALDLETDPVASGVATSLGRPGGNITGVFLDFPDFTTKWIELLVENNPKLSRMAVLWDPVTGSVQVESVKTVAGSLKIQLVTLEVRRPSDFEGAFSAATTQHGVDAMVMLSSPPDLSEREDARRTFCSSSPSGNYTVPGLRAGGRVYGLRTESPRAVSAGRRPCCKSVARS